MSVLKIKIQTLKNLRAHVSPSPEWLKSNRATLLMQISNTLESAAIREEKFSWWRFNSVWSFLNIFLPKQMVGYVLRPVMAVMAIFGLVFGGWTGTVSASFNSLPGDVLYSVKLATESMQTSVQSDVSKTKKEQKVEEAVKHLTNDLEIVKVKLDSIKNEPITEGSSQIVVDVAKVVDQKSAEIQKSLEQTNIDEALVVKNAPAVTAVVPALNSNVVLVVDQVKQAAAVAQDTGVKAIEVIVEKHQADNSTVSKEEVKSIVDTKIKAIEEKMGKIQDQINIIVSTSTPQTFATKQEQAKLVEPVKVTTEAAKVTLTAAKDELSKDNLDGALDKMIQSSVLSQVAEIKVDATKILAVTVEQVVPTSTPAVSTSTPTATVKTTTSTKE